MRRYYRIAEPHGQREESSGMARKNSSRKAVVPRRKGDSAKSPAAHGGSVAKPAGQAVAKPVVRASAKPAAAPPAPPKVKFRGRMLENEVLSRYSTYRIGGPARYFLGPA